MEILPLVREGDKMTWQCPLCGLEHELPSNLIPRPNQEEWFGCQKCAYEFQMVSVCLFGPIRWLWTGNRREIPTVWKKKGDKMKEKLFWEPTQVKNCKLPLVLKTILPEGCDQLLLQKSDIDWLIDLDRSIKDLVDAIEKHGQVRVVLRQVEEG
jgi:hypothetical protein